MSAEVAPVKKKGGKRGSIKKLKGLFTAPKPKPTSEEPVASASQEMSIEDKQNAAAVKVQANFRGFQARKEVEALKMETASPDFLKGKKRFLFGAVVVAGLVAKILSARKPPPKPEPQYSTFCLGEKAAKKAGLPGCVCLRLPKKIVFDLKGKKDLPSLVLKKFDF